jgi:hypothetical protein
MNMDKKGEQFIIDFINLHHLVSPTSSTSLSNHITSWSQVTKLSLDNLVDILNKVDAEVMDIRESSDVDIYINALIDINQLKKLIPRHLYVKDEDSMYLNSCQFHFTL